MTDRDDREESAESQLRKQVSTLGAKFLERTRGEATQLRELVERLRSGDTGVLKRLQEMAHKIHGSGAMFGFPAISECADEIERLSEQLAAGSGADELRRLTDSVEHLAKAVEAAVAGQ